MTTERADCTFVVKEDGDGRPFLQIEPSIAGFDIAFTLRQGATIDETNDDAHTLARQIRSMIVSISLTLATEPYVPNIVEGPTTKQ